MNMLPAVVENGRLVGDHLDLPVPARLSGKVQAGQKVTIGIRPPDISLVEKDAEGALAASVEVTEYLGKEALLDIRVGARELIAEVPASQRPSDDADVFVRFNPETLHIFDAKSGASVNL